MIRRSGIPVNLCCCISYTFCLVVMSVLLPAQGRFQKFLLRNLVDWSINFYSSHPLVA